MDCVKCAELKTALDAMESNVKRIEMNMGWKIPVYALIALRELKLQVSVAKEKLKADPLKAP